MSKFTPIRKIQLPLLLLALLWTALIWHNSLCPAAESTVQSSRVEALLLPILDFLCIPEALRQFLIRKAAHLTEFAVLGLLWSGALPGKRWYAPLTISVLTAIADESIQRFVPGRSGQIRDVLIDTAGVLAALVFLWLARQVMRRWARSPGDDPVPD